MLGICNGFQALIKLGLVPYGKITDAVGGNSHSDFQYLRPPCFPDGLYPVTSVKSPWFAGVEAGDIHAVPVSHGEGRFVASDA